MTNKNLKRAIRAYMSTHGVNYTTAKRALADTRSVASSPAANPEPVTVTDPAADLYWQHCRWIDPHPPIPAAGSYTPRVRATGKPGATCAACGEALTPTTAPVDAPAATGALSAPATEFDPDTKPDRADLTSALTMLAHDEATIAEHTNDPESPVTFDLLRLAVLAEATHGRHHRYRVETSNNVVRSALLGLKITPGALTDPHATKNTHQFPVDPNDLAATLATLAEDTIALDEIAHDHAFHTTHLTNALLALATDLGEPSDPSTDVSPARHTALTGHPDPRVHYLTVTADPLTDNDRATLDADEIAEYLTDPDKTYAIECPGVSSACEGWEECIECRDNPDMTDEEFEERDYSGTAHGVEHKTFYFGWSTATGECALTRFADAWVDSASDLNLPPGRYAIDADWDESCTLYLINR